MPDMAMCIDHGCPSRYKCRRYAGEPSRPQVYADFQRGEADQCCYFVSLPIFAGHEADDFCGDAY